MLYYNGGLKKDGFMKNLLVFLIFMISIFLFNNHLLKVDSYNIDNILSYESLEENIDNLNIYLSDLSYDNVDAKKIEKKINSEVSKVLKGMKFFDRVKAYFYFNFIYRPKDYKEVDFNKYGDYILSLDKRNREKYMEFFKREIKNYERN